MLLQPDHESLSPALHSHDELSEPIIHKASEEPAAPTSCIRDRHAFPLCCVLVHAPTPTGATASSLGQKLALQMLSSKRSSRVCSCCRCRLSRLSSVAVSLSVG